MMLLQTARRVKICGSYLIVNVIKTRLVIDRVHRAVAVNIVRRWACRPRGLICYCRRIQK